MDPTARGAEVLGTRPGAPLSALEDEPDERQEIRQPHDGRLQKRVGAKDKKTEIHVRFRAHYHRHGDETQNPGLAPAGGQQHPDEPERDEAEQYLLRPESEHIVGEVGERLVSYQRARSLQQEDDREGANGDASDPRQPPRRVEVEGGKRNQDATRPRARRGWLPPIRCRPTLGSTPLWEAPTTAPEIPTTLASIARPNLSTFRVAAQRSASSPLLLARCFGDSLSCRVPLSPARAVKPVPTDPTLMPAEGRLTSRTTGSGYRVSRAAPGRATR